MSESKSPTILLASSEISPLAKTGGLADVCGSLPQVLQRLGVNISLVMPKYRRVMEVGKTVARFRIAIGDNLYEGSAERIYLPNTRVPLYLINQPHFFDRPTLYTEHGRDYPDNLERFTYFCRAVIELIKQKVIEPDIIHANDWQSALIPAYCKVLYADDPRFKSIRTLFTIHNLAYQGFFSKEQFPLTGLPWKCYTPEGLEFYDHVNLLKGGILYSDRISTVSKRYAEEIQTPEFGCGLEGVLQQRKDRLIGVLNGVDYSDWAPQHDQWIPYPYGIDNVEEGKTQNKHHLLRAFKLPAENLQAPVMGVVSRLASQKGLDLLAQIVPDLLRMGARLVVLGTGEPQLEDLFESLHKRYPRQCGARILYDNHLAHLVEAGSDIFLMPSKYEPCGLNQMYSLRYGTIPVVRHTGGLADTIKDYTAHRDGYGFVFYPSNPHAFLEACARAVTLYENRHIWWMLVRRAMRLDFSWERSARQYIEVFHELMQERPFLPDSSEPARPAKQQKV